MYYCALLFFINIVATALKSYPLLSRLLLWILLPIFTVIVGGLLYLKSGLPETNGSVVKLSIKSNVTLVRDKYGVPHVAASTDYDAFYAMGYLHAQDRLWQMEIQRRMGTGRLSEVFGASSVPTDKYMRTLGLYRAAKSSWEHLSPSAQASLQAYADGVNGWLDEKRVLPPEFLMFGLSPEKWTVNDSLVGAKLMALSLSGGYKKDLERLEHIRNVGEEMASDLTAIGTEEHKLVSNVQSQIEPIQFNPQFIALQGQLAAQFGISLPNIGSNNWVVSGKHTVSGKPILANDPHMVSQLPSVWYLAQVQGDKWSVAGATLPGLPYVIFGHNDYIGWGGTNMATDSLDLFIERTNPQDSTTLEGPNGMEKFTVRREYISVRPELLRIPDKPIEIEIRTSRHGPLISDAILNPGFELALSWSGLSEDDTTIDSMMALNYARNWEQFRSALSLYVAPTLNFVYADTEGNIGYTGAGRVPIRKQGQGMVPVPGWNDQFEWIGWIPFDEMPQSYNPESGVLVTANNKVITEDYPHFLGNNWSPSYRADRITSLLMARINRQEKIGINTMAEIQQDQFSLSAATLLPYMLTTLNSDANNVSFATAKKLLQGWDAVMDKSSVATTLYYSWTSHLQRLVLEDDIGSQNEYLEKPQPIFLINVLAGNKQKWCDDNRTAAVESCAEMSTKAMTLAIVELEHRLGSDMSGWTWGSIHKVQYRHTPFSNVRGLKSIFHRELENGGGDYTVNVATTSFNEEFKYLQFAQPSYRQILDLNDLQSSVFINTPGQSGNVLSAHYDDLMEMHGAGKYIPMHPGKSPDNSKFELLTHK